MKFYYRPGLSWRYSDGTPDNDETLSMDPAYISVVAALAGSTIGGLTSLTASWLSHHAQFRAQQRASDLNRREELYKDFVEEASKWYADAFTHNTPEVANLVNLYALVSRMRIESSSRTVESAERVVSMIIDTYLAPNKTFRDLAEIKAMDPLREFGKACRAELRGA
jgi:hypothetical protein